MLNKLIALLVCAAGMALLIPGAASAATIGIEGSTMRYVADPGVANNVLVSYLPEYTDRNGTHPPQLLIRDVNASTLTPGPGCKPDSSMVICPAAGITDISIGLGDLDDQFQMAGGGRPGEDTTYVVPVPVTVTGDAGDDDLDAGSGFDTVANQAGAIRLEGGEGDDILVGSRVAAVSLIGDTGNDRIAVVPGTEGPSRFATTIAGDDGDDEIIASTNQIADTVSCGAGTDTLKRDPDDNVDRDCEGSATPAPAPATGARPNLEVVSLRVVRRGTRLTLTAVVQNWGVAAAPPSQLAVYLSTDRRLSAGDHRITSTTLRQLASGGRVTTRVHARKRPEARFVIACVDRGRNIAETDESDNCTRHKIPPRRAAGPTPVNTATGPSLTSTG